MWISCKHAVQLIRNMSKHEVLNCIQYFLNSNLFICACYIPPGLPVDTCKEIVRFLADSNDDFQMIHPKCNLLVRDEFNRFIYFFIHQLFSVTICRHPCEQET